MHKRRFRSILRLLVLIFSLSLVAARSYTPDGPGATITVTTFTDEFGDAPNTGCSLREAIQATNIHGDFGGCVYGIGSDVINLPAGEYHLTRDAGTAATIEDNNVYGDLDIFSEPGGSPPLESPAGVFTLQIIGAGMDTTIIDGSGLDRVMHIQTGESVFLQKLTIQNGETPADDVYSMPLNKAGGGILNYGYLSIDQVRVQDNKCGHGETGGFGGGIYNGHTLIVNSSFILRNQAGDGGSGVMGGNGGGIFSYQNSSLTIVDSIIATNSAGRTPIEDVPFLFEVAGNGGGIYHDGSFGSITNTTIINNKAGDDRCTAPAEGGDGGGIVVGYYGSMTITTSSIIFNRAGNSISGIGGDGGGMNPTRTATVEVCMVVWEPSPLTTAPLPITMRDTLTQQFMGEAFLTTAPISHCSAA
jgi:CSLREA domain-containing protein